MVYKVSKGGVRSGNTLRGLRSLRTKRYSLQACLLGRSSLPRKDVNRFLESSTDNPLITSTLNSTDVLLSLNKKQRWRLPATISHMIKTGSFKEDKAMMSLLERHKLKRRANCVSFVSNKGRVRRVAPKQKRYFSFNLDNIDEDESNRQKRRQKAKAMQRVKAPKVIRKDRSGSGFQTMQVYTASGIDQTEEKVHPIPSSKPEYRLEVYYPCPQSCSLTFNPKYTDVVMEMNQDGEMEIRQNKTLGRSRQRHRVRFGAKDVADFTSDMIDEDVDEMWEEEWKDDDAEDSCQAIADDLKTAMSFYNDEEVASDESEASGSSYLSENILASLIAQAEKARSLCEGGKIRQRRKSTRGRHNQGYTAENKSHIVYSNQETANPLPAASQSINEVNTAAEHTELYTARVILSSVETCPEKLMEKYGHLYAESESKPRRFVINITEDIQNLLAASRNAGNNTLFTSFLVFTHDGFYDEGVDAYKVLLNTNVTQDTKNLHTEIPFEKTSIEEIVNRFVCTLLDMKENGQLNFNRLYTSQKNVKSMLDLVNEILKVRFESFHTADEISRAAGAAVLQGTGEILKTNFQEFSDDLDTDIFCEICYENVNPTQIDAVPGTQLTKCGHRFCDECWRTHLLTKSRDGALKLTCPGYQCDTTLASATLLSLLHISEISKLLQRQREDEVETSPNAKWCPNPECGRVIRLNAVGAATKDFSLDVTCACGNDVCFSCLSTAHWPARCDQAEDYMDKLATIQPPKETTEELPTKRPVLPPAKKPKKVETVKLNGRYCPKCKRFMEKNGGCPHMLCKCGFEFCWTCMKPYREHLTGCKPNPALIYEYAREVVIRHIELPKVPTFDKSSDTIEQEKKPVKSRQRVSMYQKAVQQRLEAKDIKCHKQIKDMARAVSQLAQRDLTYKNKILSLSGQEAKDIQDTSLVLMSVLPHVTRFLHSSLQLRAALHHVAEFTFVLLQDAPNSVDKRRALALANDISGYCSFIRSILELGENQDVRSAIKRLTDIQIWARRAIGILLAIVDKLKG